VEKLGRHFQDIKQASVTAGTQRNWHTVEITLEGDGIILRGEERSDDMYTSIDQVMEKLEAQVKRFKGKRIERVHPGEPPKEHAAAAENGADPSEEKMPRIVRSKKFTLKPMSADEAAMQMEMLNHDFFIFQDTDTDQISVIYKRHDGNYGIIEPEM
jgi:putative sigma-54 modulation protein